MQNAMEQTTLRKLRHYIAFCKRGKMHQNQQVLLFYTNVEKLLI